MPAKTHGYATRPNGRENSTYMTWECMWQRCTNSNHNAYKHYGGRGIKICKRWRKFENFLKDMGERPKGLSYATLSKRFGVNFSTISSVIHYKTWRHVT